MDEWCKREVLERAYSTLARVDRKLAREKFRGQGWQRDERRHQKQPGLIYKTIMNARLDRNGRRL